MPRGRSALRKSSAWRGFWGGVAAEHHERHRQDDRERWWAVVRHHSIGKGDADDQRTDEEDPAEHQRDSEAAGDKSELAPKASGAQRKHGHAEANEKNQSNQETAHPVSPARSLRTVLPDRRSLFDKGGNPFLAVGRDRVAGDRLGHQPVCLRLFFLDLPVEAFLADPQRVGA